MATPQEARVELARRELAKRQSASQASNESPYPVKQAVSDFLVHPIIEGGAMAAGALGAGALATPSGPVGMGIAGVAGGTAMYPMGKRAAEGVDRLMGLNPPPPKSLPQELVEGATMETGGRVLSTIPKLIKAGTRASMKAGIPTLLGPSKEAVVQRLDRNAAIRGAGNFDDQAERLPEALTKIKAGITNLESNAAKTLRDSINPQEGALPTSAIDGILSAVENKLKVGKSIVGPAKEKAANVIGGIRKGVSKVPQNSDVKLLGPSGRELPVNRFVSEKELRGIIQSLDSNIDWTRQEMEPLNNALESARTQIDTILKSRNKSYAQAIAPESEQIRLLKKAQRMFNIQSVPGQGLQPGSATAQNIQTALRDKKAINRDVLREVGDVSGTSPLQEALDAKTAQEFRGGNAQGSRRTMGGAAIGGAVGTALGYPTIGTALGAVAGQATDVTGREMAGSIIDAYVRAMPFLAKIPTEAISRLIATGALDKIYASQVPRQ